MSPRLLAAIATALSVLTKMHLTITAAGVTVSLFVPWVLLAALVLACAVLAWLAVRSLRGFRSSPCPRPVSNWSV